VVHLPWPAKFPNVRVADWRTMRSLLLSISTIWGTSAFMESWKTAAADFEMHVPTQGLTYQGQPNSRMHQWQTSGPYYYCPQPAPRSGESQPSENHGRHLRLIVRCLKIPNGSFTMADQLPESMSSRPADIRIPVPEHLHDMGNASLQGVMEDICG
jgi:hypothetical protein